MFWNNTKKQLNEKKSMVRCRVCSGSGYEQKQIISLKTVCRQCGGEGEVDWINNATGNEAPISDHSIDLKRQLSQNSILELVHVIKKILEEEGYHSKVIIDIIPYRSFHSLCSKSANTSIEQPKFRNFLTD